MTFTEKQIKRQERRKAINIQNTSSKRLSMSEALAEVKARADAEARPGTNNIR